jgi:penicillin amidase
MSLKTFGLSTLILAALAAHQAEAAEIVRDKFGVPHIYGANVPDAFFGYGYAVAEDRLFQLEMRRRQATGTLAAVLGAAKIPSSAGGAAVLDPIAEDIKNRREYDKASLMAQFNKLPENEKELIKAYLDGVNLRITEVLKDAKLLPKPFNELWGAETVKAELKLWTLDDMLAATTNALSSYTSHSEAERSATLYAALVKKYAGKARDIFDTLLWMNDPYAPTTMGDNPVIKLAEATLPKTPATSSSTAVAQTQAPVNVVPANPLEELEPEAATTSMAILVGKEKTGGASIQLNGPQPGWFLPSYFYSVGLHAPGYDVVGHAPGGLLAITTGDNGHIAWGSTAAGGDHTTIFQETLSPDKKKYQTRDGALDVKNDSFTLQVKGAKPVDVASYRTHRGPFITKLDAPVVYSKQNLWKGHELTSVMAWQRATQAKNWEQFHAEGQRMAMGYNWFYSDKNGDIGWLFGGYFPKDRMRQGGTDPRLPAIGKDGEIEGSTYADRIFVFRPSSGYLVNWNNKPKADYANMDLHIPRWAQGDRGNVLNDLMHQRAQEQKPITREHVIAIYQKATTTDVNFYHFGPLLKRIDASLVSKADKDTAAALALLQKWDGARLPDPSNKFYAGAAVPIFQAWLDQFVQMTVGGLLSREEFAGWAAYTGTLQLPYMKNSVNLSMGSKIALRGLQARMGLRPNDVPPFDVLQGQDPGALMLKALQAAVVKLKATQTGPMDTWKQAMVPQAFFPENYEGVPTASRSERPSLALSANRGAMQRLAVGGAGQIRSEDANPPGTSSDPASPHYSDQLSTYGSWGFKPLPLTPEKPMAGKVVTRPAASKL